jgi:hypothetical protein
VENPLAYRAYLKCWLGPYSQHYVVFVTYKLAQKARVLHNTRLKRLAGEKHSNLLVQFVSYEEYEVL